MDSSGKYEAIHYGELFTKYNERIENVISRTDSNKNMFLSKKNDILMPTSDVTPRGLSTASYMGKEGVILGGDILVIRSSGSLNGLFFCYLVNLNKKDVIKLVSGSTVFHLYGSDMAKFELKLPPLKEQESIVKILATADKEIAELEKKLNIIKEQKRFLLNNLITGVIRTPEGLTTGLIT
jgi:type I restriction enzyme, S subunit